MKLNELKKKIKFYLAVSFIISLFIMLRVAIKEGNLVCGIYYEPSPCSIIAWIIQTLIFTVGVTIIIILLMSAVKTILKYGHEIKKTGKIKIKKIKAQKQKTEKELEKEEEDTKIRKKKKEAGIIRV
jgi:competence protein ComGC